SRAFWMHLSGHYPNPPEALETVLGGRSSAPLALAGTSPRVGESLRRVVVDEGSDNGGRDRAEGDAATEGAGPVGGVCGGYVRLDAAQGSARVGRGVSARVDDGWQAQVDRADG